MDILSVNIKFTLYGLYFLTKKYLLLSGIIKNNIHKVNFFFWIASTMSIVLRRFAVAVAATMGSGAERRETLGNITEARWLRKNILNFLALLFVHLTNASSPQNDYVIA